MKKLEEDYASAKSLSFEDIPIIDLEPLLQRRELEVVAKKLMSAALNTGFFYIKNHGIDQVLIDNAFKTSQSFFNRPIIEKQAVSVNQQQRGWLAPGIPYYNEVCNLGHQLLLAIAVGLGEKSDFFAKRYTSPLGRGQLVYYPKSSKEDEDQQRFGAAVRTDFGVLTLLH